jgi:hypothetical protein
MRTREVLLALGVLLAAPRASADTASDCLAPAERGQERRDGRRLLEARADFLACSADTCPTALRKQCQQWLDELVPRIPRVAISARDGNGHDVVDVRVLVDGKPFQSKLDGAALPLDPGEHVFRFESPEHAMLEERVLVREGEANRLVTVQLHDRGSVAAPRPAPDATEGPPPRSTIPTASIVLGIAAALGAGAFALFSSTAKSQLGDLRAGCGVTQSCDPADVSAVRRDLLVANVALGAGVVALAGAVYFLVQRSQHR